MSYIYNFIKCPNKMAKAYYFSNSVLALVADSNRTVFHFSIFYFVIQQSYFVGTDEPLRDTPLDGMQNIMQFHQQVLPEFTVCFTHQHQSLVSNQTRFDDDVFYSSHNFYFILFYTLWSSAYPISFSCIQNTRHRRQLCIACHSWQNWHSVDLRGPTCPTSTGSVYLRSPPYTGSVYLRAPQCTGTVWI